MTQNGRLLARGAAVLVVAGLSAGCSSNLMRFDHGVTASTAAQPVYGQQASQEPQQYPGDLDQTTTASINRGAVQSNLGGQSARRGRVPIPSADVGAGAAAPAQRPYPQHAAAAQPFPAQPRQASGQMTRQPLAAPALDNIDRTTTGSIQPPTRQAAAPRVPAGQEGWNSTGGTEIKVREGETVYNLSRRFGVPANEIMRANGLDEAAALRAGQTITIPSYVYSRTAPTSSPDANPKVAAASSTRSGDAPARAPGQTPDRLAVLPQPARVQERDKGPQNPAATGRATTGAVYTVVAGDTLSEIANKTGSSTNAIKQANGLDSGLIRVGQKLVIPGTTVQANAASSVPEGVDPIVTGGTGPAKPDAGYTPPKRESEIDKAVQQTAAAPDATGVGRLRWPAQGRIVSGFGSQVNGKRNDGIDIALPEGSPVKAAENGVVIYAGDGLKDFGNTVLVRHENGLVTVYGHNSQIMVSRGTTVRRGQEIAKSGLSGNAGAPKLHFEVRKDSAPVDPAKFLE